MLLHEHQRQIAQSKRRFKVIRGGRRGGKTALEIETLCFKAVSGANRNVFYVAPTQVQARSIIWEGLKARLAGIGEPYEQRLEMKVPTVDKGFSLIKVAGWENRENFRGQSAFHITFDETDTMRDFFIGWQEIFRPALIDRGGTADFIGTPKKENPNLRRLEKEADEEWGCFQFTSWDNPTLPREELEKAKKEMDADTYRQEIMAEYVDNAGSLFKYSALVDMFTNTITKGVEKYMTIDVAEDGSDKTVFTCWQGLEAYRIDLYSFPTEESLIAQIKEIAASERIPYSQIAIDAIGVGSGASRSAQLAGMVPFKSSFGAIKTDNDIVRLPNVHYLDHVPLVSEYRNLRSQCIFELARLVNEHAIACAVQDVRIKSQIIDELAMYQDVSKGDGKRFATEKEDIKALLGRSPDVSDTFLMRMYFVVREHMQPYTSETAAKIHSQLEHQFVTNQNRLKLNGTR